MLTVAGLAACEREPREEFDVQGAPLGSEQQQDVAATEQTAAPAAESAGGLEVIQTEQFQPNPVAGGQPIAGTLQVMIPGQGQPEGLHVRARVERLSSGEHAWHIHSAACGQDAPIVVAFTPAQDQQGLAQPLIPGADGAAEQTVFVPAAQLTRQQIETGAYSVPVHERGGVDHGPTGACANV